MTVWMVETGEYESRYVHGLYVSLPAAITGTKAAYGPPYRVRWKETQHNDTEYELRGYFECVPGYSTDHVATFDITPQLVHGAPESVDAVARTEG